MEVLGIDIGGTGIKGALVNIETGEMVTERFRIPTPQPATPSSVIETATQVVDHFNYDGILGVGLPAIVKNGVACTAANIHKSWIGTNAAKLLKNSTGCRPFVCNDADLAGLAEMEYGAGKGEMGTVILITIGTGLGSALFVRNHMVPNTEFGHLYLKGMKDVAEKHAAGSVRKKEDLSWKEWAGRFNEFLELMDRIFSPDLVILGGGGSKGFEKYKDYLLPNLNIKPAVMQNNAGIIGSAIYAHQQNSKLVLG